MIAMRPRRSRATHESTGSDASKHHSSRSDQVTPHIAVDAQRSPLIDVRCPERRAATSGRFRPPGPCSRTGRRSRGGRPGDAEQPIDVELQPAWPAALGAQEVPEQERGDHEEQRNADRSRVIEHARSRRPAATADVVARERHVLQHDEECEQAAKAVERRYPGRCVTESGPAPPNSLVQAIRYTNATGTDASITGAVGIRMSSKVRQSRCGTTAMSRARRLRPCQIECVALASPIAIDRSLTGKTLCSRRRSAVRPGTSMKRNDR